MHKNIAVKLQNISKIYKLYDKPVDRLKESLHPFKKKYHKEFYALKNINLEIKKGEVLGIVGVNGAGKSTLLKIIAGVLTPTSGRITINGKINAILELSSGLKGEMTGRQNIKLNLQINGIEENVKKLTQEIIDFADIGDHIDQPVKTYSSGMKARLGFGLATSTDPDVLIVDEVLAVGDVLFRRKCYNRIENLFKNGKTVIFVSHDAQSVIEFCSTAILLYDREVILEDSPKKVTDYYQKLVFSKDHSKVLDEIKSKEILEIQKYGNTIKREKNDLREKEKYSNIKKVELPEDKAYFIPDFLPKSTVEYDSYKTTIRNVTILDQYQVQVNVLIENNRYTYSYDVEFEESFNKISFGMQIKSEKGQSFIGCSNNLENKTFNVLKGEIYQVSFEFDCLFKGGVFYTNCGVSQHNDDGIQFLNRITDAYVFKVHNKKQICNGLISLKENFTCKILNSDNS